MRYSDYNQESEERNQIRAKMTQCFEGISVVGLPLLTDIPSGKGVDYPYLNQRFKEGLATITEIILAKLPVPRQVEHIFA